MVSNPHVLSLQFKHPPPIHSQATYRRTFLNMVACRELLESKGLVSQKEDKCCLQLFHRVEVGGVDSPAL